MSLNFYLGEVTAQSAAAKQMANEYMQFCGTLKDSVNAFMNAPLSGKTYDSAKLYFSTVYPTLASGFILACEALIEAHSKFPEEFQSQVDTCDVIEDQLKAEIAQGQVLLQSMARTMDKEKEPNQRLEQRYMGVQSSIQKNEEKLQRLYEFNASSPGLFADFEAQLANLDAGLAEVEKGAAWNSGSGTFDLDRMNMAWTKPINTRWKKREEMRQAKLKNGSTGKANTLADHGLTEADLVQVSDPPELVYQKYIKFAALGLNPHTGKPLTDKEKLQFQYAAHAGTMSDLIGLVGGAYAGQKAVDSGLYGRGSRAFPQGIPKRKFAKMSEILKNRLKHISDDIFIQGSRAGGTAKSTSDIDVGVRVNQQQFDNLIRESFGEPNPGSAKEKTMLHAIKTGKIQAGEAKLRGVRKELEELLGMDADVSIILEGGAFDNPPYIPIK